MVEIKNFISILYSNKFFKKLTAYALLIAFIYISKDFLGIFLLTFIFAYVFLSLGEFIKKKWDFFVDIHFDKGTKNTFLKKIIGVNIIIIILYIIFISLLIFILSDMLPKLINELSEVTKTIPFLNDQIAGVTNSLNELRQNYTEIGGTISEVVSQKDMEMFIDIFERLKSISIVFFQIILSLVLSFVFIIDRKKLRNYLHGVKKSNFKFLYVEYKIILKKISNSFGLILKAQGTIALINAIFTILGLLIIGYLYTGGFFPFILTFGLIVFLFGFIPVLGVFISSVPILIISYNFVGPNSIYPIIALIISIHAIEAYYLNPKIVSSYLELPVSLTFIILIVSEHLFGFAGLLIGVSLFYFVMGLLKDADKVIGKANKKLEPKELIK